MRIVIKNGLAISFSMFFVFQTRADPVEVKISGVDGAVLNNIVAYMTFFQKSQKKSSLLAVLDGNKLPTVDLPESEIRRANKLAPREIERAMQPFGYYSVSVTHSLTQTKKGWQVEYQIQSGEFVRLRNVEIDVSGSGVNDGSIDQARKRYPLISGDQLSHVAYEKTKTALLEAAFQAGYLDARYLVQELRIEPDSHVADVKLSLDTGPLFYFGDILFEQNALESTIIRRFLPFKEGDPFDADQLATLQLRLEDTEYFDEIEINAQRDNAINSRIPITIKASAAKPHSYTIGAGYGTDTGPRVNAGLINRLVNQKGHQLRGDLRVSAVGASIQTQYQIPINEGTKDHIAITAAASTEEVADTETDTLLLGIGRFESWRGFQRQLYVNYESEKFELAGENESIELLIPGMSLSKKVSDNFVYPRRGYSIELDIHGASESLLSDTSFIQGTVSFAAIRSLGNQGRLLIRGEVGATESNNFDGLPFSQRFFTGGDRSVRGFEYQEISPENESGEKIGSRYLSSLSVEADYLFYDNFGAATFIDAGSADDDAFSEIKVSAGIGFRYRSPIGMIRLDLAQAINEEDQSPRLHVSIGADL